MKAPTIKSCDLPLSVAAQLFELLNPGKVHYLPGLTKLLIRGPFLLTDVEPNQLTYPEGWFYSDGIFRNTVESNTGHLNDLPMFKSDGKWWGKIAKYCTLDD